MAVWAELQQSDETFADDLGLICGTSSVRICCGFVGTMVYNIVVNTQPHAKFFELVGAGSNFEKRGGKMCAPVKQRA